MKHVFENNFYQFHTSKNKSLITDRLLVLILDITNDIKFQNNLTSIYRDSSALRKVLGHYSASISEETTLQYTKANEL